MKLYLKNHTERYPVEQLQLQLFAQEPSEFCTEPFTGDGTVSSLSRGKRYLTATAKVTYQGKTGFASNRVLLEKADVRATRRILQRSYYLAALQVLPAAPPWGALSGVRPTKLSTKCLMAGGSERDAERLLRQTYFVSPERARLCVDASRHTVEAAKKLDADDLSVYIGIPFCPTRCAYCSFSSGEIGDGRLVEPYMAALLHEIEACAEMAREMGLHIRVGYIGGGTPSSLTTPQLDRLLAHVERHFGALAEFTVEAGRPDTLDAQKLRMLRDHPVTRISINPQTMNDVTLARIGRAHTAKQTVEAYELARSIGFDDINMDVIAALPGEDYAMFAHTLAEIRRLRPESLTVHTLAIKRSSRLNLDKYPLPDGDRTARMVRLGGETARALGMKPYYLYRQKYMSGSFENTGWCRPGYTGLYNIYMMEELHTILSLGGGGMNKINLPEEKLARYHNPKIPQDYISRIDTILQQKDEIFSILREIREQNP